MTILNQRECLCHQLANKFGYFTSWNVSFCHLTNTLAYNLGINKPLSPSNIQINGPTVRKPAYLMSPDQLKLWREAKDGPGIRLNENLVVNVLLQAFDDVNVGRRKRRQRHGLEIFVAVSATPAIVDEKTVDVLRAWCQSPRDLLNNFFFVICRRVFLYVDLGVIHI